MALTVMCEYMNYYLYLITKKEINGNDVFDSLINHMNEIGSYTLNFCYIYHEWFNQISDIPSFISINENYVEYCKGETNLSILLKILTEDDCPYDYMDIISDFILTILDKNFKLIFTPVFLKYYKQLIRKYCNEIKEDPINIDESSCTEKFLDRITCQLFNNQDTV